MTAYQEYLSHPPDDEDDAPTLLFGPGGTYDSDAHLPAVARRVKQAIAGESLADGTPAAPVANAVGLTHDIGKLARWVQSHLRSDGKYPGRSDTDHYHAFAGAIVTRYCLEQLEEVSDYATEIAVLAVAGHHSVDAPPDPQNISNTYGRTDSETWQVYDRVDGQVKSIHRDASDYADAIIARATRENGSWSDFKEWYESQRASRCKFEQDGHVRYFDAIGDVNGGMQYYGDLVRTWTALKFADQTEASGLEEHELEGSRPDRNDLDEHVSQLDEGEGILKRLNQLRDQARQQATENATALVESDDVGLITLPTGFGKTFAGLSAGLQAADVADSRLIYVLPYTSILDQTAQEIESVFDVSPYSDAFTLHHHLSDTFTGLDEHHTDTEIGRSPGELHAESWLSGLTLTTTVQLFESLAAPTARQATRVPSLHNSVVVIDEPQAIPEDWWQIVPLLVELLVKEYDATVILMTATQPGLVKYGSDEIDTRHLVDNPSEYTDFLAENPRVTYRVHDTLRFDGETEPIDYPKAGNHLSQKLGEGDDVLAICNTRDSAEQLYRHTAPTTGESNPVELGRLLHNHVDETGELPTPIQLRKNALDTVEEHGEDTIYAFLSGNVRPDDRSVIIDALYDDDAGDDDAPLPLLESDCTVALVSTSVVEAGVDVSFDVVFRDYAPIPNIVQSGGRCNRSFDGETGEVIIWQLAEPEGGSYLPSIVIHGAAGGDALPLLSETGRVLRRYADATGEIDEATMVSETVSEFYESLNGELSPGDERLAEAVEAASMSELEGERMIDDIEGYEDVLACLTTGERRDLLSGELEASDTARHPGAQVNTDPETWTREEEMGNSTYLVVDALESSYHPIFGVR